MCNLSEVNVLAFVDNNNVFDEIGFYEAIRLAVRIGVRMTLVDLELPEWDAIQKRDRLTGVSLTGLVDALDACPDLRKDILGILESAKYVAHQEARDYAYTLRIPTPLLVTCI